MNTKPGARHAWVPKPEAHFTKPGDPLTLLKWQHEAYAELHEKDHWIMAAMTGSGKGFALRALGVAELIENPAMKMIVAVPQLSIAHDFFESYFDVPGHGPFQWDMRDGVELCGLDRTQRSEAKDARGNISNGCKVDKLLAVFRVRSKDVMARVVLCTHATLAEAFKREPKKFRNVRIVIDEAHHLSHRESEFDDQHNQIGAVVSRAMRVPSANIRIGLCSATPFRADGQGLVSATHLEKIARFEFPFDEFLQSLKYLSSFKYDFATYSDDYRGALKELLKDRVGRSIIYIPGVNSNHQIGTKYDDRDAVYASIAGSDTPKIRQNGAVTEVFANRFRKWIPCIDLVDEDGRSAKYAQINEWHGSDTPPEQFVIISLNTFKEGANCKWLDAEYVLGPRQSQVSVMQMLGRVFRDAPGKESVSIYQLLPFNPTVSNEEQRKNLNDYWVCLVGAMMMLDAVRPIQIQTVKAKREDKRTGRVGGWKDRAFSDPQEAQDMLTLGRQVLILHQEEYQVTEPADRIEAFYRHLHPRVVEAGHEEWALEIAEWVYRSVTAMTMQAQSNPLQDVDFDVVTHGQLLLDFVPSYFESTADNGGLSLLRELAGGYYNLETHQAWAYLNEVSTRDQWYGVDRPLGLYADIPGPLGISWPEFFGRERFRVRVDCNFEGCDKPHEARGYCKAHYMQLRRGQKLRPLKAVVVDCNFEGCDKPYYARGYCKAHYVQLQRGQELRPLKVVGE